MSRIYWHSKGGEPFSCPRCGHKLWPQAVEVAWSGGGASLYHCAKCRKYYWWVWCCTSKAGGETSFYVEAGTSLEEAVKFEPRRECASLGLLCWQLRGGRRRDILSYLR